MVERVPMTIVSTPMIILALLPAERPLVKILMLRVGGIEDGRKLLVSKAEGLAEGRDGSSRLE
jgi:hypothetical protein